MRFTLLSCLLPALGALGQFVEIVSPTPGTQVQAGVPFNATVQLGGMPFHTSSIQG